MTAVRLFHIQASHSAPCPTPASYPTPSVFPRLAPRHSAAQISTDFGIFDSNPLSRDQVGRRSTFVSRRVDETPLGNCIWARERASAMQIIQYFQFPLSPVCRGETICRACFSFLLACFPLFSRPLPSLLFLSPSSRPSLLARPTKRRADNWHRERHLSLSVHGYR